MIKTRFLLKVKALMILLVVAVLQVGCNGGGGAILAEGGIGGTGATISSVGTVTGFGSVIVNGVAYDTGAAEVFVKNISRGSGDPAVVGNLSAGMVVRVEGKLADDGSAKADRVFFSSNLKGVVESVSALDSLSKQAVILGQTILMDDRTVFRNSAVASIAVGMVLEVSGYNDDSGRIFATYINKVADSFPPDGLVEIKGLVRNLIPSLKTFEIGGLNIDYSASDLSRLPGNTPEEGLSVKVSGRLEAANRLVAEHLEPEEEFGSRVFDVVDLEGIITQTGTAGEFRLGRYTVRVDQETSYNNLNPQDLNRGTRVIVHGSLTNRVIFADEIFLSEKIRMESNVRSIDIAERSLALAGLESIRAVTTATTRIIGIAAGLDEISPDNHVRVVGRRTSGGDILASMVLVTPSNDSVELAGPLESILEPFIVIVGTEVNTSPIPSDGFKGVNGKPVSPGEFFGVLQPGDSVLVKGLLQAGQVSWEGIALEKGVKGKGI